MIAAGQPLPGGGPGTRPAAPAASTRPTGLVPLDQMTADERYKGEDGGLYGGGKNTPPEAHRKAAEAELAKVVPLDASGKPAADGKIVLLSMGMSNTTQEFSRFVELARADKDKSPALVVIDGGARRPGRRAVERREHARVEDGVGAPAAASVTPQQVQVMWVKHARIQPARFGEWPKHAQELQGHWTASLQLAKERFPNLRIAYLSSRIYAGYASTGLNPEPFAYEGAFVVRRLILGQAAGFKRHPELNCDAAAGPVKAPLLLWARTCGPTARPVARATAWSGNRRTLARRHAPQQYRPRQGRRAAPQVLQDRPAGERVVPRGALTRGASP